LNSPSDVCIKTDHVVNVVDAELAARMSDYRFRLSVKNAGYPVLTDWHPTIPEDWGKFPQVPVQRATVYRGDPETWAYSHHHTITKFRDKYVASWSNSHRHEDHPGQEVHYATSADGLNWSEPRVLVHTPVDSGVVRNNAGLYASDSHLYCYVGVGENFEPDVAPPDTGPPSEVQTRLDVYQTTDLENWTHHENICPDVYLFEGPRMTQEGKLMCCGFDLADHHAMVLIWDEPAQAANCPRVIHIAPSPAGVLPEQGTWYQTDDGVIWLYQRDGSMSLRLGLTWSYDGGETWTDLLRTDFPNSYSRAFAGQLSDGRYYIVGNNYDAMLDRRHMLIALSDDGRLFDRQYTLVEGDTTRRINGRHKEDGYHYPNCLVDDDRLLVIYSVNKEDIEVGIVDMSAVR